MKGNSMKGNFKKIITGLVASFLIALSVGLVPVASNIALANTDSIKEGALQAKASDQADTLFGSDGIFVTITNTALFLIGAVSVVMLIYGGIRYTVSGDESGAVTNAKNTILYAIVGIVIAILAYAAVQFVIGQLVK